MTMKELALQLGISTAMVSRLAARGMPTDSVERAQRWRKRHLQFTRMKGVRADSIKDTTSTPMSRENASPWPPPPGCGFDWAAPDLQVRLAEYLGQLAAQDFHQHSGELRRLLDALSPADRGRVRLPVEVWDRLLPADFLEETCQYGEGQGEPLSDDDLVILGDLATGRRVFHPA